MDIQNGNYADVHGIVFRNIRIEYQADTLPEVYQKDDRMKYDGGGVLGVPTLLVVDNRRYGGQNGAFGDIHDIVFEDVSVFAEAGVPRLLPVRFANHISSASLGDITIRNLTVNGVIIFSPEDVDFSVTGSVGRINWE